MSSEKNEIKLVKEPTALERFMTNQKLANDMDDILEKTKLSLSEVKSSLPKVNVMNTQLKTTEVETKDYNLMKDNPKEIVAIKKYNVHNFYNQITSNIVIGAKAIFLVCRDLVAA